MTRRADSIGLPAGTRPVPSQRLGARAGAVSRPVVEEVPLEIRYAGQPYAVMMVTPCDLEDFVRGFTLSERLARSADDIRALRVRDSGRGWVADCELDSGSTWVRAVRRRQRVADSSCGLCGIEQLAQVRRRLPRVTARLAVSESALFAGLDALVDHQPMNRACGGVHAAAFATPQGRLVLVREDVGRHNAFDKLIGAAAAQGLDMQQGFVLLSSRCSYELVEKAIIAGVPMLVTISAPTSLAIERAAEHDLALVTLARADSMLVVHDPHGAIVAAPAGRNAG